MTIPACEPVSEIASWPRSLITIAASAHEIRSPVESSMSISRGCGRSETSCAIATSSSVVCPARRQDGDDVLALLLRGHDPSRRALDALGVGHGRASELHDDGLSHGAERYPRASEAPASDPALWPHCTGHHRRPRHRRGGPGLPQRRPGAGPGANVPEAGGGGTGPRERTSFLARLIPPPPGEGRGPVGAVARSRTSPARLPLERKVAQLFLLGFEGQDLTAPIFEQMRRQDLGGLVFENRNYLDPQQIASMAGEGTVIAADEGHVPPFVMVSQEGGEFSEFPDLPPAQAPSEFASVGEAEEAATEAAHVARRARVQRGARPGDRRRDGGGHGRARRARLLGRPGEGRRLRDRGRATPTTKQHVMAVPKHFPGLGAAGAGARGRADAGRPDRPRASRARPGPVPRRRSTRASPRC